MNRPGNTTLYALALIATLVVPCAAVAADSHAQGKLTLQGENKSLDVEVKHAYYVSGPDRFEATKMTRSLVFAVDDLAAVIQACADIGCATALSGDGLVLDLGDAASPSYWAHVRPMQYSGFVGRNGLRLRTDSSDRLAGSLTIAGAGVKTTIEFDVPLTKTFAADP